MVERKTFEWRFEKMFGTKITAAKGGLSAKHKIGYGLGDAGGCMTFSIMGSTFAMYCTDALKVDTTLLSILLIIWPTDTATRP